MLYILHGPEEFLRAEAIRALRSQLGDPSSADINTTTLDARRLSLAELINAAEAMPFLGGARLVVVAGLLGRLQGKTGKPSKADQQFCDALAAYLPQLSPTTWLVFDEDQVISDPHPILRVAHELKPKASVQLFARLNEAQLRQWLSQRAQLKGGALGADAVDALVGAGESDLRLLDQEVEKLIMYAAGRTVTAADVQRLTHGARSANVFVMVDALGQRNGRKAIEQFHALVDDGEPAGRLLFMIARQFRMILQAKDLSERRASSGDMMRALGAPKFLADKIEAQSRHFSMTQLEQIYHRLLETDQSIKTGQADPLLAVDVLMAEIASRRTAPPEPSRRSR